MNQGNVAQEQPSEEYRMYSTKGLRLLSLTGRINTIMKVSGNKLSFDMFPKELNYYPEVEISNIASVEMGQKFAPYHIILAVITCAAVVTIPYFLWLGKNTTVTIHLKNGGHIVMYSANKNNGIRCYEALQRLIGK